MILFDKLKNKRSSLQEVKDDTTGRSKKPIKVNLKNLVDKTKKNPLNKNLGVKITDTDTIKQSEVSKKAKAFTKDINKKRIKKVFPGDKSGAYQRMKSDIDTKNLIKKAGGSGDIGYTAPDRKTKVAKRTTRAIKQGTPDPFKSKTKFSQKGFEKSLKKSSKGPGTGIVDPFGKGDTKGMMNVKAMDKKAFKKTQPRDVKLPKSFTDFSKKLKTYKTDVAKTGSSTPRTITKKFTPTVGVKQSEVSKKAKDFTKQINQNRTSSGTPMRKGATTIPKDTSKDIQVKKMKDRVNQLVGEREKMRSASGKKDVAGMRNVNKQIKQYTKSMNTKPFVPTVYNKKTAGTTSGAKKISAFKTYPTAGGNKVTQSTRSLTAKNKGSVKYNPPSKGITSPPLSSKGKKVVSRIPGFLKKNKTLARIGKAAVKNPYVAGAVGVGLAAAGIYAAGKAFANRNKGEKLSYKDFKSLSTPSDPDKGKIIHTRDIPKLKIKKGDVASFPSARKIPKSTSAEFKNNYAYK